MYTKNGSDRAAVRAVLFYNSRNKYSFKGGKCRIPMCKEGKCICLDTVQAKLLCPLICERVGEYSEHIIFETNKGAKQLFSFPKARKREPSLCQKRSDLPFDLYDFGCFNKDSFKKELNLVARNSRIPKKTFAVFHGLSVFFLVNSTAELQERDSELYLAVYGYDKEVLLKKLFIGIMETVIRKSLRGEALDGVANAVEYMCGRLHYLATNKIENLNKVADILEVFDGCIGNADITIESYVGDDLMDYRELLGSLYKLQHGEKIGDEERRFVEQWEEKERNNLLEVLPIYALTKAVCCSVGLKVNWPEDLWIEKMLQNEGEIRDYDVIFLIDKLNSVSEEIQGENWYIVLKKLGEMLKSYNANSGNFLSEDIERLKQLA